MDSGKKEQNDTLIHLWFLQITIIIIKCQDTSYECDR